MQCRWWLTGLICCMLGGAIPGCNAFQGAATDADEDLFAELDDLGVNGDAPAASAAPLADAGAASAAPATMTPAPPRWRLGDRFPLEKTVFQKVTQVGLGTPSAGSERLQLLLSLTVEEVSSERARFGVRYHRVRLVREMAGETFDYDSGSSTAAPPPAALAYAGMINDGFSFWLTTDGRVGDLVGFSEFLQRCAGRTTPENRQQVLTQLAQFQSGQGVASFVDDSVGMLPAEADGARTSAGLRIGSAWQLAPRQYQSPAPMVEQAHCIVKQLSPEAAEVSLFGKITPGAATSPIPGTMSVAIREGHATGQCQFDRRTGLPTKSHIERRVSMLVTLPDGTQVAQEKEVVTALESFPTELAAVQPPAGQLQPGEGTGIVRASAVEHAVGTGGPGQVASALFQTPAPPPQQRLP